MTELEIKGFALDRNTQMPMAVLKETAGHRLLLMWTGPFETSAIIGALEDIRPPRPLTHDTFSNFFSRHGFQMDRLEIYGQSVGYSYYSRLLYHGPGEAYSMEIRPSDGLALAVRLGAPLFAASNLLRCPESLAPIQLEATELSDFIFLNVHPAYHSEMIH